MAYKQLIKPNTGVLARYMYCLEYARKAFNRPAVEPTAWVGWERAKYKHKDRKLPNVAVPCWFSFYYGGRNLGHVVVYVPGQGFYSSPYRSYSPVRAKLGSLAEVERIYGCKFVGWTEDISGGRVAAPVAAPKPKPVAKKVYHIVKKGEYLSMIAPKYKTTWQAIAKLNGLKDPNKIAIGQKLRVK